MLRGQGEMTRRTEEGDPGLGRVTRSATAVTALLARTIGEDPLKGVEGLVHPKIQRAEDQDPVRLS